MQQANMAFTQFNKKGSSTVQMLGDKDKEVGRSKIQMQKIYETFI